MADFTAHRPLVDKLTPVTEALQRMDVLLQADSTTPTARIVNPDLMIVLRGLHAVVSELSQNKWAP